MLVTRGVEDRPASGGGAGRLGGQGASPGALVVPQSRNDAGMGRVRGGEDRWQATDSKHEQLKTKDAITLWWLLAVGSE